MPFLSVTTSLCTALSVAAANFSERRTIMGVIFKSRSLVALETSPAVIAKSSLLSASSAGRPPRRFKSHSPQTLTPLLKAT